MLCYSIFWVSTLIFKLTAKTPLPRLVSDFRSFCRPRPSKPFWPSPGARVARSRNRAAGHKHGVRELGNPREEAKSVGYRAHTTRAPGRWLMFYAGSAWARRGTWKAHSHNPIPRPIRVPTGENTRLELPAWLGFNSISFDVPNFRGCPPIAARMRAIKICGLLDCQLFGHDLSSP